MLMVIKETSMVPMSTKKCSMINNAIFVKKLTVKMTTEDIMQKSKNEIEMNSSKRK